MDKRGSLLILAIWVLLLLALFTSVVGRIVQGKLKMAQTFETKSKLRYIAEAGVQKAIQVLAMKDVQSQLPDVLNDGWSVNESAFHEIPVGDGYFTVGYQIGNTVYSGMIDEESKISLRLITSARILSNLFQLAGGLSKEEAAHIAYALLDCMDEDDHAYEAGAEKKYYMRLKPPYQPKNEPLDILEEMNFIRGMTPAIYERLSPYLTLYGSGLLNLNTASPIILVSIGMSESLVKKILRFRAGEDGVERTPDDHYFISLSSVAETLQNAFPLDDSEAQSLHDYVQSGLLTLQSSAYTVQSLARLRNRSEALLINCVTTRTGDILYWHEKFLSAN